MKPSSKRPLSAAHLLWALLLTLFCFPVAATTTTVNQNLEAFAKLYGYVRFFHPSDEASTIDWNRFAIHGVSEVRPARDAAELRDRLRNLFLPIAPAVEIFLDDEEPLSRQEPAGDGDDLALTWWQHYGPGSVSGRSVYRSVRVNRPAAASAPVARFATIVQSVDAKAYRGKTIRFRAAVRAEADVSGGQAQLWVRVDRPNRSVGFFDNMSDRPITSSQWAHYEITGPIASDAEEIFFGGIMRGLGEVFFDSVSLEVLDGDLWSEVEIVNPGFESSGTAGLPQGWGGGGEGYAHSLVKSEFEGKKAVRIASSGTSASSLAEPLFEEKPRSGEIVEADLGRGLRVRVPLTLLTSSDHTLPRADASRLEELESKLETIAPASLSAAGGSAQMAGVIIVWNVMQHFYPYFDVIDTEWEPVLGEALSRSIADESLTEHVETLSWMMAKLHDGHGWVIANTGWERLPFLLDWIEGEVVVVAADADAPVRRGDIVRSVDGVAAADALRELERQYSGSPQWRRDRALRTFGQGPAGTTVAIAVEREGQRHDLRMRRDFTDWIHEPRPEQISEIEPGVVYVDLTRADVPSLNQRIDLIAEARAVIFDMRGYPRGNVGMLGHLTDTPLQSPQWQVPQIIRPDQPELAGYETVRWPVEPEQPRVKGKVVFLTNESAISASETLLGMVKHYDLGRIVGQPTAGTNGNAVNLQLPGGAAVMWTGMRTLKHDGSQHHLIGILPDVPVERTIRGVREGRDELLERALEIVRERSESSSL